MNILYPVPVGQNGVDPIVRSLNAKAESLNTVITPGFINSILQMGNTINPDDLLLVSYANGTQLFNQSVSDGVITLSPASETVPFPLTNVQFVAKGGSDLNIGNNINAPKLTIQAALNAISANGLVWVLDSAIYENEPFVMPIFNATVYAPNAQLVIDAASGSLITQNDTGSDYVSLIYATTVQAAGGANAITQNGALSELYLETDVLGGPSSFEGFAIFNCGFVSGNQLSFSATATGIFDVSFCPSPNIAQAVGANLTGKLGNVYYDTQTVLNQLISQQQELQETVGRQLMASDSNSTIQYMSVTNDAYVLHATVNQAIPIGTVVRFMQLSSGAALFNSDGTSTVLNYLNVPSQTGGLNAVAEAEKISDTVWMVSGNIAIQTGP